MYNQRKSIFIFLLVSTIFIGLYTTNIAGWLIHDDEGTDLYEVWRLQLGEQPGVDFLAEQQPLFLLAGSLIVDRMGRDVAPLRLLATAQTLAGAIIFSLIIVKLKGWAVGTMTLGFILTSGLVFEQARLFRPDPMMLAWGMVGFGAVLLAATQKRFYWWGAAGFCYGVSFLWKPFAIFPVVGLFFYFLYLLYRQTGARRQVVSNGAWFAVPFLLIVGGGSLLLYSHLGFYYLEPLRYHVEIGRDAWLPDMQTLTRPYFIYFLWLLVNPILIVGILLSFIHRGYIKLNDPLILLVIFQVISPVIFSFITRPLYPRYFIYLAAPLAILAALQFDIAWQRTLKSRPIGPYLAPFLLLLLFALQASITIPRPAQLLLRQETDTLALADYVAELAEPDELVFSDYASINFHANRGSIYEASIIAGAQLTDGIISAEQLIEQLDARQIKVILVHVAGGAPGPHHLVALPDYDQFRAYLEREFTLLTTFDRAGQEIEIHWRKDG